MARGERMCVGMRWGADFVGGGRLCGGIMAGRLLSGVFTALHPLRDPILYVHTKFGEDVLIGAVDVPPKRNSKKRPLAAEICFQFQG